MKFNVIAYARDEKNSLVLGLVEFKGKWSVLNSYDGETDLPWISESDFLSGKEISTNELISMFRENLDQTNMPAVADVYAKEYGVDREFFLTRLKEDAGALSSFWGEDAESCTDTSPRESLSYLMGC